MLLTLQSACGLIALLCIAWLLSENRRVVAWRIVIGGVALQLLLALLLLKAPPLKVFFLALNDVLNGLERATQAGTSFVFGYLGGSPLPFDDRLPVDGAVGFRRGVEAIELPVQLVAGRRGVGQIVGQHLHRFHPRAKAAGGRDCQPIHRTAPAER